MRPEVSEMSYLRRGRGACGLGGVLKAAEDELGALMLRRDDGDEHDDRHCRHQLIRPRKRHEARDAVRGHHVDEAVQDQAHCRGVTAVTSAAQGRAAPRHNAQTGNQPAQAWARYLVRCGSCQPSPTMAFSMDELDETQRWQQGLQGASPA